MKFDLSLAHMDAAQLVTPNGSQTGSKAPGSVGPIGAFPLFADYGKGAHLADIDGNAFIDWYNGNCAVTLGHGNAQVADAVSLVMRSGSLLSLPSMLEAKVASRLVELIPCAEQVRFVKTGSEACAGAARIARMATGRQVINLVSGQYHGWHDWHCVTKPSHPGVPEFMAQGIRTFTYNDLASLEGAMGPDVAAVMLEPTLTIAPASGFLAGVVEIAHRYGALVIFDEMITGARWHVGGAQAYYGVTPDLGTFGKAYGNGVPLAFIAGRTELMRHAWPVSGTFGGDGIGLAACNAVLDDLAGDHRPIEVMWAAGLALMSAVNGRSAERGWPMRMVGPVVRPVWQWDALDAHATSLLQQELAAEGILVHPSGWNTSACHVGEVLVQSIQRVLAVGDRVAAWMKEPEWRGRLRGHVMSGGPVRSQVSA